MNGIAMQSTEKEQRTSLNLIARFKVGDRFRRLQARTPAVPGKDDAIYAGEDACGPREKRRLHVSDE